MTAKDTSHAHCTVCDEQFPDRDHLVDHISDEHHPFEFIARG